MEILNNYEKTKELLSMLIELNMDLHKEENRMMNKRNYEKAKECENLKYHLNELMKGIE